MNKKLLLMGFLILIIIPIVNATINECDSFIWLGETCRIITPAGSADCTTIDIVLSDGTLDVDDGITTELLLDTGHYYYDYTPTESGSFCAYCQDNTSACFKVYTSGFATEQNISSSTFNITNTIYSQTNIILGSEENRIIMVLLIVVLVLYILGRITNDYVFPTIAGFLMMGLTIYIARYGFVGFDNSFVRTSVIIIFSGIGLYLIINYVYKFMVESMGK